jgi:hypothetical protein
MLQIPQWLAGETGYALAIVGFLLLVIEWVHVFNTQGNTLARDSLRAHLLDWREARDTDHGTGADSRAASIRRMRAELRRIRDKRQRELFSGYVGQLENTDPANDVALDRLDRAFAVGTPIEEEQRRPRRRTLMLLGAVLVVVGTLGQMVSTYPKPFG